MNKKVLIVGGVAGGASTAARLRRLDENADIIMFERDEYISFANCGLPYYIGDNIKERDKLLVQTPEAMNARFRIDVRNNSEVIKVDTANKRVTVNSKAKGIYEESYDYLVLSPGAKAIRPTISGIQSNRIFTLRNIPDTDRIKAYVDKEGVKSAIVIGGGFIGVEMAENLKEKGMQVTLVEAAPHILAPFDTDMVVIPEKELIENGVHLILEDGVREFRENDSQIEVTLNSNKTLSSDLVILAIGVIPDTGFLKDSGIVFGPKGHIIVNEKMETNIEGVYAVGDAVEVVDYVTKQKTAIPLAGPANKQGRIAADNIAGIPTKFHGTQGTSIIKVFGLTAASTGANERTLKRVGMDYKVINLHPVSHASYYPGALPMTLKLIFDLQGKILGAQAIGYDGVDKRIDVIATVLHLGGTVDDLAELELSYAPPFSSAKDPVNMAGFMAQNVLAGRSHIATWEEVEQLSEEDYILLDVRSEEEFLNGHISGAINIPVDGLRDKLSELSKDKVIVEYCQVGLRGYVADRILSQSGYRVYNVTGGYKSYTSRKNKMITEEAQLNGAKMVVDPDTQSIKAAELRAGYADKTLDACGLCCPGPLMQVKASMEDMKEDQILKVTASDPGFMEDIKAWCTRTNNELLELTKHGGNINAFIRKTKKGEKPGNRIVAESIKDNKTMVVFSGDLDKAIASFIIANGAASMGKKVTMFFTFWGLNILRKPEKVSVKKGFMDTMFGVMMPRGSKKLKLSNMNMMGMGGKMIRKVMKNKNIQSLEDLINSAIEQGIEIVACQMSMDVMGLKKEELIDGVKIGGVGYYLGEAEDSNVNLFI
ncbi:MAG: NAD(FAD)-dependent dehydrogenase [Herbinix sp.]|jgi:NADPH-dependent 2,4-dienoyl-CoA reductase/sulfur reductase-like enzyme/peroxiredoxin family protein|nr:NAD(FAD)-dependent dehydrogenase [Herbinix sp.]